MLIAAFIVGIALFFEVGLVLLIPLVFTIAKRAKVSPLKLGLPMVTALSVTHGFTTTSWSSSYSKRIKSEYWTCVTMGLLLPFQ